ncbi:MAG: hypothetical protein K9L17_03485 [Clostridiales bacterium]|nr:hypothetical protein [Clostridiales bacterium]MCF8021742.1 hypothetical protein [Clostridiales bacterium]
MAKVLSKSLSKNVSTKAKNEFYKSIGFALGSTKSDKLVYGKLKKSSSFSPKYKK